MGEWIKEGRLGVWGGWVEGRGEGGARDVMPVRSLWIHRDWEIASNIPGNSFSFQFLVFLLFFPARKKVLVNSFYFDLT